MTMSDIERQALVRALKAAKSSGLGASRVSDDGGTCVHDCPVIHLPKGTRNVFVKCVVREAGLLSYKWGPGEWHISGCTEGQARAQAKGAAAAVKTLIEFGVNASLYEAID